MISTDAIKSVCSKTPGQMSFQERKFICDTLINDNCTNLLVFGAGHDSELWSHLSTNTHVVEHDSEWLKNIQNEYQHVEGLNFYKAYYNTFNHVLECIECMNNDSDRLNVTIDGLHVESFSWDAVIVDAPTGYRDNNELYRAGSIRLAAKLTTNKCHVFVHDVNRRVESLACGKYFKNKLAYNVDRLNYYDYTC